MSEFKDGEIVGERYRIVRVLGRGGVGVTYEAEVDGQRVALKQLVLRGMGEWKTLELFQREAKILAQLQHPTIPRYLDSFELDGDGGPTFCLVQQLAPGRSLSEAVKHGWRPDERELKAVARTLLEVLAYLHEQTPPVIHRDIKPDNIIRHERGGASEIRLVDFGAVRDTYRSTVGGGSTIVGTYGYMAPEQLRGQAAPSSDLYGLGATLLFLATRKSPAELPSRRLKIEFREHARLSPSFASWLERMVEPAHEDRFASAREALSALERGIVPVRPSPAASRSRVVGAAAAALTLLALGGAVLLFVSPQSAPVAEPSPAPTAVSSVQAPVVARPEPPAPPEPPPAPSPPEPSSSPASAQRPWWPEDRSQEHAGVTRLWRAEIGYTTFRSTIHAYKGKVVVNSNGASWGSHRDDQDGVYILDGRSGEIETFVRPTGGGEKDTNGVALADDYLVFGTDQDIVHSVTWTGETRWKQKLDGDPEAAPALADLDGDGALDVAIGSEGGYFYALSGETGAVLWKVAAEQPSPDGRAAFIGAPALYDVTGDGTADVFVPSRDRSFRAINGRTGDVLWTRRGESGMHGAPVVIDVDGDGAPEVAFTASYSTVYVADARTGALRWETELEHPGGGIEGLFSPVSWYPEAGCVLVATAWWSAGEGVYCVDGQGGKQRWRHTETSHKLSSGAVIGDVDGKPGAEAVFGTEAGEVIAVSPEGQVVWRHGVGGPVECTPTLADLDGDGKPELLVAANDGYIQALRTPGQTPPTIGYHRGSPRNEGVFLGGARRPDTP